MAFTQWTVQLTGIIVMTMVVASSTVGAVFAAGTSPSGDTHIPLRTIAASSEKPLWSKETTIGLRSLPKAQPLPANPVVVMPPWRNVKPAVKAVATNDQLPALRTLGAPQSPSQPVPSDPMPELRPVSAPVVMPTSSLSSPSMVTMPPPPKSALQIVADSATQQLPAGTLLRLTFLNGLNSGISEVGEPFTAMLNADLMGSRGELLLPKGTALRGRIDEVLPSRFFSRGGMISLAFDHVVLPTGQQLPITLQLSTDEQTGLVNKQGVLYTDPGVVSKLSNSVNQGTELFYKVAQVGFSSGKDIGNGLGQLVTVPVAAVGGAIAGAGVAAGKGAYSLVAKGADVELAPDQQVLVRLSQPTTFPVAD